MNREFTESRDFISLFGQFSLFVLLCNDAVLNSIPSDFVYEKATFICSVDKLNIRRLPSLKGQLTGDWYKKGMSFNHDGYVKRDGYVWCSYIGGDNTRRWVAVREINTNYTVHLNNIKPSFLSEVRAFF